MKAGESSSDKMAGCQSDKMGTGNSDNKEGVPITLGDIFKRARALYENVAARKISEKTFRVYRKEFARMRADNNFDPLRPGGSKDAYYQRRAALHAVGSLILLTLCEKCMTAVERKDFALAQKWAARLLVMVKRLEPAFERDPPMPVDVPPGDRPTSRWELADGAKPRRGKNSKKHALKALPKDWDSCVWSAARDGWPYRDALAVHSVVPVRPEELVKGERPAGSSPGVVLTLHAPDCLDIKFMPVKSHGGLFGTEFTTIRVDPTTAGMPAMYLAKRCKDSGGHLTVCIKSKDAVRKAFVALGRKALPGTKVRITPSVLRHQLLADFKATFGGGETVAMAAGHSTDKTQAKYGNVAHGRKRKGYLAVTSARTPRSGNTERARSLAKAGQDLDDIAS